VTIIYRHGIIRTEVGFLGPCSSQHSCTPRLFVLSASYLGKCDTPSGIHWHRFGIFAVGKKSRSTGTTDRRRSGRRCCCNRRRLDWSGRNALAVFLVGTVTDNAAVIIRGDSADHNSCNSCFGFRLGRFCLV